MAGDVPFPGVEKFPSADVLTCTLLYGTEKQKKPKTIHLLWKRLLWINKRSVICNPFFVGLQSSLLM